MFTSFAASCPSHLRFDTGTVLAWPQLHSFSIGLENSPDLLAARKAAHYLGTVHHEYTFTVQEGLDAIPDVIYHLETYDVTTVRASTPMYLLSRKIKAMGVKMVLSGEGSDEVFGGKFCVYSWLRAHLVEYSDVHRFHSNFKGVLTITWHNWTTTCPGRKSTCRGMISVST